MTLDEVVPPDSVPADLAADAVVPEAGPARVAVIGAGAWGTTLALVVAREEPVVLLAHNAETVERINTTHRNQKRVPGIELPPSIQVTADPGALSNATDLVIVAVPSAYLRETMSVVGSFIAPAADILSVVKGLENGTLMRMTEVIAQAGGLDLSRIAALSGPNLAFEIARSKPASAVVASVDQAVGERIVA
ncbi:MAG TPA: 2-dehydropantoate 2-reductase N-terminal domain-containing protein, partial [Candidatus Limnocylindrales bacterium]|nr:2-dehydropantoate 2-reductase N-terminal domain-containing protein [Candidatus Limnocylindrales bacterium]